MAVSFDQAIDTIHAMFSDMDRDTIAMILEDQQGTESPRFGTLASSFCSFRFLCLLDGNGGVMRQDTWRKRWSFCSVCRIRVLHLP